METKIIKAVFGNQKSIVTVSRMQYDYGQVIDVVDVNLPATFEARFSNQPTGESVRVIGENQQVAVPDELLENAGFVWCYITVHDEVTDGRTMYTMRIPIKPASERTNAEPTPVQQDIITQAIAMVNSAVDTTSQKASEASESADRAEQAAESIDFGLDPVPTQGSTNAVSSGGVYDAVAGVADDITGLKQDIITGLVSIGAGTEEIVPSTTDFQVAKITPKNGNVIANSVAYMNIDGVGAGYYTLMSTGFLSDDIKSIQSAYSSIKFVLFVYDKTSSEYLGAIFDGYVYKNISDLTSSNTIYPYSEINMDTVRGMFPNYKYKLEITDTAINDRNDNTLPVPSNIINWCTYTVPRATSQRQLVKTVNNTAPDNSGNIELNFLDSVDAVPTAGSENPVASGGVKTAIDAVIAQIPDIDDTLTQTGQGADSKAVGDEISALKQDIIDGKVAIGEGTQDIIPSATDFRVARITPKNGIIADNSGAYMNIGGVGNTYYPLITTDFLPDNIKAIQSAYSDVKFVLFVYDRTSSEYLGAIYREYTFKSMEDLASSNTLYPYTEVNMDTMRTMFPNYKYRLEITDASVNQSIRPVTTDITQWCTYTVPSYASERQLVMTVNNTAPDNSGNISLSIPGAEEMEEYIAETYERISLDSSKLREGFYRYDTGISNRSYQAVIIPKGDQSRHTYYGILFKDILPDNIYKIKTSGTIYALIAGWDRTNGSFVGYYTGEEFEIPEREINANNVDTQNISLKGLRETYPTYFFKVSFVDVSTYDRPNMDDILDSVIFVYESASKYELGKVSDTNIPELPAYWADYLDGRIEDIRGNMTSVGRNGETFIFITDLHWPNNVKNSPRLMFEILRRLNIHHCICGGDVINEGTREESVSVMVDVVNAFKHYDIDFLTALGNHDRNWNTYNDQHSYPERRFTEADIFALLERMSKKVYQNFADDKFDNGIGFNMYYDDPITNTRFIIIDVNDVITDPNTGTNTFEFTNYNELAQVLHDSNGKHVVIISHMLEAGNNIGTRLATISDALNARTTISTDYCTADFTGCTGKVHLILGGHSHSDNSRLSSGGIPIVTCDTDSNLSHNTDAHIDGTTKEQAFDVITVNYADNSVKFVRIGRGSDRTFTVGN